MFLAKPDLQPEWVEGVPDDVYHADTTTVSSTGLRKMLKSPALFKRDVIDGLGPDPTDSMKFGTLVHQVILEGADFLKRYVVEPEFTGYTLDGKESKRSKEAIEKRELWRAERLLLGEVIVTPQEKQKLEDMLDSVINHPDAFALLKNGVTEISGYYTDPETGIACRIRPDFLSFDLMALVDLKTTVESEETAFARTIKNMRYDLQISMYGEGAEIISRKKVEHHVFIAVENEPPHETDVYTADPVLLEKGREGYHKALRDLRRCIDSGEYKRRVRRMRDISLPHWDLERINE